MFEQIYVEEKLRELQGWRVRAAEHHRHADPRAEVPRTGVGLVHEVFRRIAEGERPGPKARPKRRWLPAG
jgi:hypothetical protein